MAECPKNKPKGLMARSYRLTKTSFVQYFHLMLRIACLCPTQPKSPRSRVQREIYQWQEPIISMIAAFLITRWRGWQRVGRPKSPKCSDLCGFFTTDQTNGTNGPPNMGGRSRISLDSVFPTEGRLVQSLSILFQNEDYFLVNAIQQMLTAPPYTSVWLISLWLELIAPFDKVSLIDNGVWMGSVPRRFSEIIKQHDVFELPRLIDHEY